MQVPPVPASVLHALARLAETPKVESFAARLADLDQPAAAPTPAAAAPAPVPAAPATGAAAPATGAAAKPRGSLVDLVV